jgi:hypothetical protein
MGKAERQGQHTWEKYVKAGVVDTHLNWSDDPIVVAHALGKTREAVGKCWPMDAAVAYTLASAGPDANLTSKEMVNQYTKTAAAMMSQTVAYGNVPDSRVDSCNHDEINGMVCLINQVFKNKQGHISFHPEKPMIENGIIKTGVGSTRRKIPKELMSLLTIRTTKQHASRFTSWHKTGNAPPAIDVNILDVLLSSKFKPLKEYIEKKLKTTKWCMFSDRAFTTRETLGKCSWKTWDASGSVGEAKKGHDGNVMICGYHDKPMYNGWVLIKKIDQDGQIIPNRFERVWLRGTYAAVGDGWNARQLSNRFGSDWVRNLTPDRIVIWDRVSRGLSNTIPSKLVVKEINAACRRMTARNFNVVRKEGLRNTATYTWKEWNWLANLKSWIAQTRQKNRKEHDLVNGWKWTKYNSRKSYGFEIAQFKWIPGEVNDDYNEDIHKSVQQVGDSTITNYATAPAVKMSMNLYRLRVKAGYYNTSNVDWIWRSKAEIKQFIDFLPLMAKKTGAVGTSGNREWDASIGGESLPIEKPFEIFTEDLVSRFIMDMDADPEDLPSPTELFEALQWGSPQDFDAALKILSDEVHGYWERPTIVNEPKKSGDEDGGATPVIQ